MKAPSTVVGLAHHLARVFTIVGIAEAYSPLHQNRRFEHVVSGCASSSRATLADVGMREKPAGV